mgnify:CR=1 FL=1
MTRLRITHAIIKIGIPGPDAMPRGLSMLLMEVMDRTTRAGGKRQAANMAAKDLIGKSKKVEDAAKLGFCTKMEYLRLILSIKEFVRCTRDV